MEACNDRRRISPMGIGTTGTRLFARIETKRTGVIMTYEDLQDTMMSIVDKTEIDLKNLLEQYNDKARKGQIKTIDGELEDIHEIDDTDLVFAIAGLQAKLETILEM